MKWTAFTLLAGALVLGAPAAEAQSLIGTYHRCSTADEGEADFLMNTILAEAYDSQVAAGNILGWGWVEHTAGGPWRRISTITAETRTAAMTAWGAIVNEQRDEHPGAFHRFNEICDSHDDYIWNLVASVGAADPAETPANWISTYFVCNQLREARADELVQEMAPLYEKHVAAGHISGFSWYSHDVGGRFRRLQTIAAAEGFDLLEARQMIINELQTDHADAMEEMGSICGSHVDYMWANGRDSG